ncbi:hypothetical protein [Enterococcus faecium]
MNEMLNDVVKYYSSSSKISFRDVAAEFDISLLKVRKLLITVGVFSTDISNNYIKNYS